MELWKALAARRKELGMKFDTLSRLSGVPETTLKKVLTGVTTNPKMTTVKSIAGALEMTLSELDDRMQEDKGLSFEEMQLVERYRTLDDAGKSLVDHVLAYAVSRPAQAEETVAWAKQHVQAAQEPATGTGNG
mgnify:CR=1 FL=1